MKSFENIAYKAILQEDINNIIQEELSVSKDVKNASDELLFQLISNIENIKEWNDYFGIKAAI